MFWKQQLAISVLVLGFATVFASYYDEEAEKPPYTVIGEGPGGYEIREYPAANWISSRGKGFDVHEGKEAEESFWKLYRYIGGENADETVMSMSTPVTTRITPGETARDKSEYIVSFYLGGKYQDSPPVPTEDGVYVEARPAMKVAALQFGGKPLDENFVAKSQELYTLLKNDGIKPPYNYYYNAVYSAPHVRFDRKQEVWDVLELI